MIASMAFASGIVQAQNVVEASAQKECCFVKDSSKKEKSNKQGKKDKKQMRQGERKQVDLFKGIQLTADQQQRLQVLREGLGPVMPEKQAGQKLTDEQKKQMRQQMTAKRKEAKQNYLKGVKEILQPDQYVMFLENVYFYGAPEQGNKKIDGHKPGSGKEGKKAPRQGNEKGPKRDKK